MGEKWGEAVDGKTTSCGLIKNRLQLEKNNSKKCKKTERKTLAIWFNTPYNDTKVGRSGGKVHRIPMVERQVWIDDR